MSTGTGARTTGIDGVQEEQLTSRPRSIEEEPTVDDFGLPRKPATAPRPQSRAESDDGDDTFHDAEDTAESAVDGKKDNGSKTVSQTEPSLPSSPRKDAPAQEIGTNTTKITDGTHEPDDRRNSPVNGEHDQTDLKVAPGKLDQPVDPAPTHNPGKANRSSVVSAAESTTRSIDDPDFAASPIKKRSKRVSAVGVSEWSHQKLAAKEDESDEEEEVDWQAMPALGEFDIYDDDGRIVAKARKETEDDNGYAAVGGMGKGYTRVQLDEDAQSATSMDDDTNYLFKKGPTPETEKDEYADDDDDEEQRDTLTQLQTTKDILTEGQRIAYVGVTRLTIYKMVKALGELEHTRATKKELIRAVENMEMWGQQMMVRLYGHMEIDSAEQLMIEQLAEHGVQPSDLAPPLMANARVKNPMADEEKSEDSPGAALRKNSAVSSLSTVGSTDLKPSDGNEDVPEMQRPEDIPHTEKIDIDLRWTVLCDLFLVLISDGAYDARSRRLLERVASTMQVSWIQICRFEKRIMDALEMQEAEFKESHDEGENLEKRRKLALKRKYMVMGLATVGGGLVIGLSAGLLAPVIGAGLAAGFTTIGVTGTAGFLGGVGGAALITSIGVTTGGTIAVRASHRRTGHVKTFEYRPLHNNKRLNLILSVSGWMNGKVDDVRLPFSTVDPVMGDLYSLLWEPDMLRSTGDTINILATEALTQTVQQVLGSTILIGLMAAIQLPVVLTKLAYLIDNPWSVSLDRAHSAGLILADSLMQRHLGARPITLIGFSLGARLIFSCIRELANRGAYGLVQNVYLFGSPVVVKKDEYLRARSVIAGRFVNGYASNDWILGYLFRATAGGLGRVAGLAPVEDVAGLENINVSTLVNGHMAYRAAMPRLLREVGWQVESDEFTEIEDPDPENHQQRQRELMVEIDEARKKDEGKPEKKRFGLFKRGKLAGLSGWETYDAGKSGEKTDAGGLEKSVLFDIDAIRRELESEMIEVRELNSTLPPMQITSIKNGEKHTEYLRLPPEVNLSKDEIGRMKLPPRPDDVDVRVVQGPAVPARKSSIKSSPKASPHQTPKASPALREDDDYVFEGPKELVSTLPPLQLTPSLPQENFRATTPPRPALKTHATTPSPLMRENTPASPMSNITSPVETLNLEHNAWADGDDFGHDREVKMTFE